MLATELFFDGGSILFLAHTALSAGANRTTRRFD